MLVVTPSWRAAVHDAVAASLPGILFVAVFLKTRNIDRS